jgi:polar amino acid transport system permease protein
METAEAYGMTHRQAFWRVLVPQMWVYALPGLSNLWMVLIKASPLLFLLGVEDIVYWARDLGGSKTPELHRLPAWRLADVVLPVPSRLLPRLHQAVRGRADRVMRRLTHGQSMSGNAATRDPSTAEVRT